MATYSKVALSGATTGVPIAVVATASTGTTIHATGTSSTVFDEIWLYATNTSSSAVTLTIQYGGTATDPYGQVKSGFEIGGKINRQDFGLVWSATTEAGGIVVSDEVKLHFNVQMIKQA